LLVLPWAVALVKVRHQHLDSSAVGLAATFSLGLPALWLGAAGYWAAQSQADKAAGPNLKRIADGLAGRLRVQWEGEAEARRLNDPYPLPVSWTAAEASLAGDLNALKKLATTGAGWSASTRENWAERPEDLAGGAARKLADVLAMVPTGRLVVLGEPGSGKTMLMVGLVLDLLARRRRSGPVPVLATLASWDAVSKDLHGWLGDTLITAYPDLAAVAPRGSAGDNRFQALLAAGLILPILDGLDEIPKSARSRAIARINKELKPGETVVVTCRTEDYRAAVSPQDGHGAILQAAAVQLSTLKFEDVASYLRKDAGSAAEGRWGFLDTLSAESPARQALATPLMAGLARVIYNRRPGDPAGSRPAPRELLACASDKAVERLLFDAFIQAAYWNPKPKRNQWTADQVQPYLGFLAWHLQHNLQEPTTDLAWWELYHASPRPLVGLTVGLIAGLAGGILGGLGAAGHTGGLVIALSVGVMVTLAVRFAPWARRAPWARHAHWQMAKHAVGLVAGLVGGLVGGGIGGLFAGLKGGITDGVATGYWVGPVGGPAGGFLGGLTGGVVSGLLGDIRAGVVGGVADGIAGGVAAGLWAGLEPRRRPAASLQRSWRMGAWLGIVAGLGGLLVAGLTLGFPEGVAFGAGGGALIVIVGGLAVGTPADPETEAAPKAVLARDRRTFQTVALAAGLMIGLFVGLVTWAEGGIARGIEAGLAFAVATGLGAGCIRAAWGTYTVTRYWLAVHGRVPLKLTAFLDDAHLRGVLRQAGAVYQFRHIELLRRLANTWAKMGFHYHVEDVNGVKFRVTLVKIIDPARGADEYATPDSGKRFVGAIFKIKALSGSPQDENANNDAAAIGSDGQTYLADFNDISGYTNFDNGSIQVTQGETVTGSVTFQVPDGVTITKVQWTSASGSGTAVQWDVDS